MANRRNEQERTWFRSDRFFRSNERWYFHTREGMAVGPYKTRFEAEIDVGMLMAQLKDAPEGQVCRVIRDFIMGSGGDFDFINDPAFTSYLTEEGSASLRRA